MLRHLFVSSALFSAVPIAAENPTDILTGIFSNEEQVYFEKDAGRIPPAWVGLFIVPTRPEIDKVPYTVAFIDSFGTQVFRPLPFSELARQLGPAPTGDRINFTLDGRTIELRRARPAACWVAIPKDKPKPDGSTDWHFVSDVRLHDQGGRAFIGGSDSGAAPIMIHIRNVIWPAPSTNKPSLVLYVYKADKPGQAESYAWADPDAARIGINLRWMQASCTIDGTEGK